MFSGTLARVVVLIVVGTLIGCGADTSEPGAEGTVYPEVNFERPIVYEFSLDFLAWAARNNTVELWRVAGMEAPLLYNDKPNMALAPMIVKVHIADTEEIDKSVFKKSCVEGQWYAYTPYGSPNIYICKENYFDKIDPNSPDQRRDPWYGQWRRVAFLGHETGHGLSGARHTPQGLPAIMCGWPGDHPVLCYSNLTGLTEIDKGRICPLVGGGGFCDHPVAPRP